MSLNILFFYIRFGTEIGKEKVRIFFLFIGAFKPKSQNGRRGAGVVMQKYVKILHMYNC